MKEFTNVVFDTKEKTFTIKEGDTGTYSYLDITNCNILYELDKYKGKTPPFEHCIRSGLLQTSIWHSDNLWTGIEFVMSDGSVLHVYISESPSQLNSIGYHEDTKKAEEIQTYVFRIFQKYAGKRS